MVAYEYRPRDPRGKLREVAAKWTANMRVAGRSPNRGVVFGDVPAQEDAPQAHGWLIDDRRPGAAGDRYLVMEDGDVWRAGSGEAPSALDEAVSAWLDQPSDDLVMLLARALNDARMGGSGWLEAADGVERVEDRRSQHRDHEGRERRGG
jgi:hypothetical protein